MKKYDVQLQSVSPVAFGRYYTPEIPEQRGETKQAYEERTWKNRAHVDKNGVYIPALAFKNLLTSAAKYLGLQIPGKGKSTYTKHFASGVLITDNVYVAKESQLRGQWIHVPADGMRGGSKRVMKCFPVLDDWSGTLRVIVLDETITLDVLREHLNEGGNFIGVGSLRVQNNGIFGRFRVTDLRLVK
jgi:hypothetical protein